MKACDIILLTMFATSISPWLIVVAIVLSYLPPCLHFCCHGAVALLLLSCRCCCPVVVLALLSSPAANSRRSGNAVQLCCYDFFFLVAASYNSTCYVKFYIFTYNSTYLRIFVNVRKFRFTCENFVSLQTSFSRIASKPWRPQHSRFNVTLSLF